MELKFANTNTETERRTVAFAFLSDSLYIVAATDRKMQEMG